LPRPHHLSRPLDRGAAPQHRLNEHIRLSPIRLIGPTGEPLGILPTAEALTKARDADLDLVEIAPNERPPVCKLMDYGKFLYQQSHKTKKSKTHQQKLKEIRVRPKIGDHDIDTKVAQARKFLEHKDRVQVYVVFRGREIQHVEEGKRVLAGFVEKLADVSKVERAPLMEGKRLVVMLAPKQ
jgi:translation initiation factor IF-3